MRYHTRCLHAALYALLFLLAGVTGSMAIEEAAYTVEKSSDPFTDLFLYAVAAWLLLCLPVSIFLYSVLVSLLRRFERAPHVAH
jgi:hypothetical protein